MKERWTLGSAVSSTAMSARRSISCRRRCSRRRSAEPWARSARTGRSRWKHRSRASSSTTRRRSKRRRETRPSSPGCSACRRRRGRRRCCSRAGRPRSARSARAALPNEARRAARVSHACTIATSSSRLPREDVLRVRQPRAGKPLGARHRPAAEHALVRRAGGDVEVLPQRAPEAFEIGVVDHSQSAR